MTLSKWIFAALLSASATAFAGDWSLVARDKDEIVFVDQTSIQQYGNVRKARVLHSYSGVRTVGDEAFPHKSEILL